MYEGKVWLFRKLRGAPYYKDSQYIHLWVHLLMSVNWTEKRLKVEGTNKFIDLHPGQILTGRKTLSDQTGISESKVERILSAFKSEQQIEQQGFSKYRVITITNWRKYQTSEQQIEQQVNSKRTASEQQVNTKKEFKEGKEVKKEPKTCALPPDGVTPTTWADFQALRKSKKAPITETALKGIIREAGKAGISLDTALAVCCERGWQGFNAEWYTNSRNQKVEPSHHGAAYKPAPDPTK